MPDTHRFKGLKGFTESAQGDGAYNSCSVVLMLIDFSQIRKQTFITISLFQRNAPLQYYLIGIKSHQEPNELQIRIRENLLQAGSCTVKDHGNYCNDTDEITNQRCSDGDYHPTLITCSGSFCDGVDPRWHYCLPLSIFTSVMGCTGSVCSSNTFATGYFQ